MSYGMRVGITKDMDRCGLFAEMSYLHGKGYDPPVRNIDIRDLKGPQMNPGVPKTKAGLQDCYFDNDPKFKRIFVGEGWSSRFQRELQEQRAAKEKNVTTLPFIPANYTKKQGFPGAFDATIGHRFEAFSPLLKEDKKAPKEKVKIPPNVLVQPAKKGGPGYIDIGLSPYPKHQGYLYDDPFVGAKDPKRFHDRLLGFLGGGVPGYFDKNPYLVTDIKPTYKEEFESREILSLPFYPSSYARKKGDRFHAGLSEYPEYKSDNVGTKTIDMKKGKTEKSYPFYPQPRNKTFYTSSIMSKKIEIATNNKNWKTIQPLTYTKEFF